MEISNKFMAFLLIVAIIVTVGGVWLSIDNINKFALITGYQTEGNVTVNITERVDINVTQPDCAFGSGYVTAPAAYAELYMGTSGAGSPGPYCDEADDTKANWTNTTTYDPDCMVIRNDGNQNVSINVASGKNASEFIGGTNPIYKVWSENKEASTCTPDLMLGVDVIPFNGTVMDKSNVTLCSCVNPDNATDELYAGCYLRVPDDAIGYKSDTWTFTETASTGSDCA